MGVTAAYLAVGALVGAAAGGAFSKGPGAPPPPKPMPTTDDEAAQTARRRSLAEQYSRRGRQSTILSDGDSLGG